MDKVTSEITTGAQLKHVETADKAAPVIESVTLKKVDREGFLAELGTGKDLKKAETADKSAPAIEKDASVNTVDRVAQMQAIKHGAAMSQFKAEGTAMKSGETCDKSAPVIDPEAKLKTVDRKELVAGVTGSVELKKTETADKSAPAIAPGTSINQVDRVAQMQTVKMGALTRELGSDAPGLQRAETADKSAPVIDKDAKIKTVDRKELLAGVTAPQELSKAVTDDKSAPKISADTTVTQVDRVAQMQAVKHGAVTREVGSDGVALQRAPETCDKSAPLIDKDTKIKTVDRKELVAGVTGNVELKKTETADKSAPAIDSGASVTQVDRLAQMQAIKHGAAMHELGKETHAIEVMVKEMRHPEDVRDASAPVIDKDAKIKKVDRKELVAGVTGSVELKKTETADKSAPVIDKDAKVKTVDRKELLSGVVKPESQ